MFKSKKIFKNQVYIYLSLLILIVAIYLYAVPMFGLAINIILRFRTTYLDNNQPFQAFCNVLEGSKFDEEKIIQSGYYCFYYGSPRSFSTVSPTNCQFDTDKKGEKVLILSRDNRHSSVMHCRMTINNNIITKTDYRYYED